MKSFFVKIVLILSVVLFFGLDVFASDENWQHDKYLIDEELSSCLADNFMTEGMNLCTQKGINSWNKEIDSYLLKIKAKLSAQDVEMFEKSQQAWLEYYKKEEMFINRVIGAKAGDIHTTIAIDELYELTKQRALKLKGYYIELFR